MREERGPWYLITGLIIGNVHAPACRAGIQLERQGKMGTLTDYIVSGNIARVTDKIQGEHALITGNLP